MERHGEIARETAPIRRGAFLAIAAAALSLSLASCAPGAAGPDAGSSPRSSPPARNVGSEAGTMRITSSAFVDGGTIPARFATKQVAGGLNVSPPLAWGDAPAQTRSFVLAVIDEHPVAHGWVHWLAIDIPPSADGLTEGASGTSAIPAGTLELANSFGAPGWGGPQPPPGTGPHDYVMTLYALDISRLDVGSSATWPDASRAIAGHVLATATLTGRFGR